MRNLTNPITTVDTNQQYISGGQYKLILNSEGGVDLSKSYYQYIVTNLPSGSHTPHTVNAVDLPPAFKAKLKELHWMVVTYAENQGLLLPGTDTDDI